MKMSEWFGRKKPGPWVKVPRHLMKDLKADGWEFCSAVSFKKHLQDQLQSPHEMLSSK